MAQEFRVEGLGLEFKFFGGLGVLRFFGSGFVSFLAFGLRPELSWLLRFGV